MLDQKRLQSPRTADNPVTPRRPWLTPRGKLVLWLIALSIGVLIACLVPWVFAEPSKRPDVTADRLRYAHQIELGRQWSIDPAHAAGFWEEARRIATANHWSTTEVDRLLDGSRSPKLIPQGAVAKVLAYEASPTGLIATIDVRDQQGVPFTGLRRNDFRLRCGTRTLHHASVAETTLSTGKQSIAILIDCSGSMQGGGKMESAKASIPLLKSLQGPGTRFGLISFASTVQQRISLTDDWSRIESAIPELQPDGATALYAAIAQASNDLSKQPGQRRIIVIADGEDSVGPQSVEQVIQQCRAADVAIYCVGIGGTDLKSDVLSRLASETGGRFFLASSAVDCAKELRHAVEAITTPAYQIMVVDSEVLAFPLEVSIGQSPELRLTLSGPDLIVKKQAP